MARNKGKRLYTCVDCKESQYVHWTETIRNKRLQCKSCGSYYLSVSVPGKIEAIYKNKLVIESKYWTDKKRGTKS